MNVNQSAPTPFATLAESFAEGFPALSDDEAAISLAIYHLLAEGSPVSDAQIAGRAKIPSEVVTKIVAEWPGVYRDEEGRIIGYWGLALPEMAHKMTLAGQAKTLYTWCAWDSLFIPHLLGQEADVESACKQTGEIVKLHVTPSGVTAESHSEPVLSVVAPRPIALTRMLYRTSATGYVSLALARPPNSGLTKARWIYW